VAQGSTVGRLLNSHANGVYCVTSAANAGYSRSLGGRIVAGSLKTAKYDFGLLRIDDLLPACSDRT